MGKNNVRSNTKMIAVLFVRGGLAVPEAEQDRVRAEAAGVGLRQPAPSRAEPAGGAVLSHSSFHLGRLLTDTPLDTSMSICRV